MRGHAIISLRIDGTKAFRRNVSRGLRETQRMADSMAKFAAQTTAFKLRDNINRFVVERSVPPLTPAYRKRKVATVGPRPILVFSGRYVRSIRAMRGSRKGEWLVGTPMKDVALSAEFGTRRQRARPHWRPVHAWAATIMPALGEAHLTRVAGLLAVTERAPYVRRAIRIGSGLFAAAAGDIGDLVQGAGGLFGAIERRFGITRKGKAAVRKRKAAKAKARMEAQGALGDLRRWWAARNVTNIRVRRKGASKADLDGRWRTR